MISILRKHLFATNIVALLFILLLKKLVQIFCRFEENDIYDTKDNGEQDDERGETPSPETTPLKKEGGFTLIPTAMRKAMCNFGYGEGHFQIFVEEKQRKHPSKARLNATAAEAKRNPN